MSEQTRLQQLYSEFGQSPWLDTLSRDAIEDGSLAALIARGVRGVTSNPSIFEKSISGSTKYDSDIAELAAAGASVDDAYWDLVVDDIQHACDLFADLYASSAGADGYVSVEIDPRLADETDSSIDAGKALRNARQSPQRVHQGARHRGGHSGHRSAAGRGRQRERHAHLQPRALRRSARRVEARPDPGERRRPQLTRKRRFVLRQPGRHRSRQAPRGHRHRRRAWPCAARRRSPRRRSLTRTSATSSPATPRCRCSGRCGRRRAPRTRTTRNCSTSRR